MITHYEFSEWGILIHSILNTARSHTHYLTHTLWEEWTEFQARPGNPKGRHTRAPTFSTAEGWERNDRGHLWQSQSNCARGRVHNTHALARARKHKLCGGWGTELICISDSRDDILIHYRSLLSLQATAGGQIGGWAVKSPFRGWNLANIKDLASPEGHWYFYPIQTKGTFWTLCLKTEQDLSEKGETFDCLILSAWRW